MHIPITPRHRRWLRALLSILSFLALWEILSRTGFFGRYPERSMNLFLPSPLYVAQTFRELASQGELLHHIGVSLTRVGIGFGIAVVMGISMGYLMGKSKTICEYLDPLVRLFQPIPGIAWVPLAIVWFGLGDRAAIFIILLGSIFPMILNTLQGVESIDPTLIAAAQTLGAKRKHLLFMVELPSLLPYMVTGVRTGLGLAWRVVIAAEMVGVPSGLGYLLTFGRGIGRTDITIVTMVCLGGIMLLVDQFLLCPLEKRTHIKLRQIETPGTPVPRPL